MESEATELDEILEGVKTALNNLSGAGEVKVDMVFEPPWTTDMLSDEGREFLGMA